MARVMNCTRTRIELLQKQGLHPAKILRLLKTEGLAVSLASVVRTIKKLKTTTPGQLSPVLRHLNEAINGFSTVSILRRSGSYSVWV